MTEIQPEIHVCEPFISNSRALDPNLSDTGVLTWLMCSELGRIQLPGESWCFVVSGIDQEFCTQVGNCG